MIDENNHVIMTPANPQSIELEQSKQATLMRFAVFLSSLLQDQK